MRRLFTVIILLGALFAVKASATTVTGTVTDSDSIAWANGSITFKLVGNGGQNYYCSGTLMTPSQTTVIASLDSSGTFSTTLCPNASITPVNTQWSITVSSATTAPTQTLAATTISGSSQSLTSYIGSLIKAIRIPIAFGTTAYADVEIVSPPTGGTYFNLTSGVNRVWNGTSWSSGSVAANICTSAGMKCDGITDDTTAFQNLLNSIYTSGGGVLQGPCGKTMLWLGQISIPAALTTPWAMPPIRITGCNASFGGSNNAVTAPPGTPFIIDARFSGSRIISLGQGVLEIDHTTIVNGGTNCGTLIQSTLTNIKLHDNAIWGSV